MNDKCYLRGMLGLIWLKIGFLDLLVLGKLEMGGLVNMGLDFAVAWVLFLSAYRARDKHE